MLITNWEKLANLETFCILISCNLFAHGQKSNGEKGNLLKYLCVWGGGGDGGLVLLIHTMLSKQLFA